MTQAAELLSYAAEHRIKVAVDGERLILEAEAGPVPDSFVALAKQHKPDLIRELTNCPVDGRWDADFAAKGYVWCLDCQHLQAKVCTHPDNPFMTKQPLAARKCRWYQAGTEVTAAAKID